jgi:Uma2 family endonuclease
MSEAVDFYPEKNEYTYADILEWPETVRAELYNGQVFMMANPTLYHQSILGALSFQFFSFLQGKPCRAFIAPLGVRPSPKSDNSDKTFYEPDLIVVCDTSKLDKQGCNGAPDLVVEILSPSTAQNDRLRKFNAYLKMGVREYWIIDPDSKTLNVNILDQGRYVSNMYGLADTAPVTVLPGLAIDLKQVFEEPF